MGLSTSCQPSHTSKMTMAPLSKPETEDHGTSIQPVSSIGTQPPLSEQLPATQLKHDAEKVASELKEGMVSEEVKDEKEEADVLNKNKASQGPPQSVATLGVEETKQEVSNTEVLSVPVKQSGGNSAETLEGYLDYSEDETYGDEDEIQEQEVDEETMPDMGDCKVITRTTNIPPEYLRRSVRREALIGAVRKTLQNPREYELREDLIGAKTRNLLEGDFTDTTWVSLFTQATHEESRKASKRISRRRTRNNKLKYKW